LLFPTSTTKSKKTSENRREALGTGR
jgi:hypothetical protein